MRQTGRLIFFAAALLLAGVPSLLSQPSAEKTAAPRRAVLFILDASASMAENTLTKRGELGKQKLLWAQEALREVLASLAGEAAFGVRVYGPPYAPNIPECEASHLLVPIGQWEAETVFWNKIAFVGAKGKTPLAYSLKLAGQDFQGRSERHRRIILLSDGKETCGGDPVAEAEALAEQGVPIDVLAFNVEPEAQEQLSALAEATGGSYEDAKTGPLLQQKLSQMVQKSPAGPQGPASGGDPAASSGGAGRGGAGAGGGGAGGAGGAGGVGQRVFDFQSPAGCGALGLLALFLILTILWILRKRARRRKIGGHSI